MSNESRHGCLYGTVLWWAFSTLAYECQGYSAELIRIGSTLIIVHDTVVTGSKRMLAFLSAQKVWMEMGICNILN